MRILLVNYEFPPIGGGASRASFCIARELVRLGHHVDVITSRFGGMPDSEEVEGMLIHRVWSWRKGIHDCGLRGAATFLLSALPRLHRLLREKQFDLVHYFFSLPTGLLSAYSCGVRGVPYVVSLRGSDVPRYDLASRKLRWMHAATLRLTRGIWQNAARVVAVSDGLRQLAKESFPHMQIDVIHNGVDALATHAPSGRQARTLRIACVSRLIPRKGLGDLLRAVALLPDLDLELKIAGGGHAARDLTALAVELGVQRRVEFLGEQVVADVRRLYASADIFMLPTHSDAFANVILEAMSAGLPVVVTDVGGAREAVEHGTNGLLVQPHAPAEIASAIRQLAADPQLRRRMSQANLAKIERCFTWQAVARQYSTVYARALEPASQAAAR